LTQAEKTIALCSIHAARLALYRAFHIAPDPHLVRIISELGQETARIQDAAIEPERRKHPACGFELA
jgi:hypothetical protein